jgi:tRNA dimethylallyltransferase
MGSPPTNHTVLAGPTASGKTDVGVALALLLDAEIISADSRQVYHGSTSARRNQTPSSCATCHITASISAIRRRRTPRDDFFRDAGKWMRGHRGRGKRVLVVGGSGLYIRALTDGIFEGPEASAELRAELEARIRSEGLSALVQQLRQLDPETAVGIDARNPVRVIRALEVCLLTGRPYSALRLERMPELPYDAVMFGLRLERSILHGRIERRVDAMIDAGLVEEVRALLAGGADPAWTSLNTVGYKEIFGYLTGSTSLDHSIEAIKRSTRQYAKRQMTWFRKETRLRWIDVEKAISEEEIAQLIKRSI